MSGNRRAVKKSQPKVRGLYAPTPEQISLAKTERMLKRLKDGSRIFWKINGKPLVGTVKSVSMDNYTVEVLPDTKVRKVTIDGALIFAAVKHTCK